MSTPQVILGIDPGLDGGIALICPERALAYITPTRQLSKGSSKRDYDTKGMIRLLRCGPPCLVIIEAVHAIPKARMSTSAMFRMGFGLGLWHGMLCALEIPFQCVTPQAWKKVVLAGTKKDKAAAITFCQRRFPGVSLLASPKCRTPHDGMADSLCLAEYGRRISAARSEDDDD